ncbi:branched-chain amino acid ABC transporter permease [Clostridium estertheticum]|uniref:branched-chain amino acid ABC transporter permease n=1 Tax=Clostridium estertheticum TaxID=238834 RepID=UPI001C6DDC5E|nr:branched-chain amino acid ABC transporter permease [Clostridium estertheticum]MBW9152661.1 branched-chain amino acid ABC transporter permease [Clostridium estertheticum]WLC86018.1 branched-chain amino acid ABC transporter permease [Clostridium estertheticum]
MEFLQQIINGLSLGFVYALIAIGYTMVYGIIGLINFAHGDVFMVGGYFGFFAATMLHLSFIPTLLIAMGGAALTGVVVEKIAYKPLRNSPKLSILITAIAMSVLLENLVRLKMTTDPQTYPETLLPSKVIHFLGLSIDNRQLIIIGMSILLVVILQFIVFKTKTGKAMRATSFDKDAAALMGINVNSVISITFAIGSALAGAAGVLFGILYSSIDPYMGIMPGLKAFVAAVLGGIGIIPGALWGGLIMGLVETFSKVYISSSYSDAIAFSILIIILIVKPSGLLGKKTREKV